MRKSGGLWRLLYPEQHGKQVEGSVVDDRSPQSECGTPGTEAHPPQPPEHQGEETSRGVPEEPVCHGTPKGIHPLKTRRDDPRFFTFQCPQCHRGAQVTIGTLFSQLRRQVLEAIEKAAPQALELGWTPQDLFCMRQRVDLSGLVGILDPTDEIVHIGTASIEIRTATGAVQSFYRRDHRHPWMSKG